MFSKIKFSALAFATATLIGASCSANAALIVFNDQATFLAQVQPGFYLEDFEGEPTATLTSPHVFTNGTHSFQASAPNALFITTVPGAGRALSHRNDFVLTLSLLASSCAKARKSKSPSEAGGQDP